MVLLAPADPLAWLYQSLSTESLLGLIVLIVHRKFLSD